MHDTLIQGCVGVSTLLEAASHAHDVSPSLSHELLDRARNEVRNAVDEARLAVWNLRHGSADGVDLHRSVCTLADRLGQESGKKITVEMAGSSSLLGAETEGSLLLLVREALQNAVRHAAPNQVSVVLRFERRCLQVDIEDDGRGFDSTAEPSGDGRHYGLIGMRERAEKLGGTLAISSAPGKGTLVRLRVPVARSAGRQPEVRR